LGNATQFVREIIISGKPIVCTDLMDVMGNPTFFTAPRGLFWSRFSERGKS
jgi:hypothetical protein